MQGAPAVPSPSLANRTAAALAAARAESNRLRAIGRTDAANRLDSESGELTWLASLDREITARRAERGVR